MNRPPYHSQIGQTEIVRLPGWAVAIGGIVAGALGIALFLASASLILMLAPVIIGVAFYIRWRIRQAVRKMADDMRAGHQRKAGHMGAADGDIIDGEYRIITPQDDHRHR